MITAAQRALERPAEGLALLVGVVAGLGIWVALRRGRSWGGQASALLLALALVGLGAWLAWARELAAVAIVRQIPRGQLAAHVASAHAAAAGGLWWCLAGASLVCSGAHRVVRGGGGWPERSVLAAVGLLALTSWGTSTPEAGLAALVLLASGTDGALARAGGLLALAAAACGIEAAVARTLVLASPIEDLQRMGRIGLAWWGWGGAAAAWLLGALPALRTRWVEVGIAAGIGIGIAAVWLPAASRARSWGPPAALGRLGQAHTPPVLPGAERFVGGCVWRMGAGGWQPTAIGRLSIAHAMTACPPDARAPRPADRPVVLADGGAPARALIRRGVGELRLLVRLSDTPGPARLEPWRWGAVPVPVLEPRARGWRPLPDPVVVDAAGARRAGGVPTPLGDEPDAVLASALQGASLRTDVVILPHEGLDVATFLSLCEISARIHPRGLRCALGIGGSERWDQLGSEGAAGAER